MASILDYLLPKSFMADVQATFRPKQYDKVGKFYLDTGKGKDYFDDKYYDAYLDLLEQGYQPTQSFYDYISDEGNINTMRMGYFDPYSQYFAFKSPEDVKQIKNIFEGHSLAEGFEQAGFPDFDPSMARPAELSTLRKLDPGSYTRKVAGGRDTLIEALARQRQQAGQLGSGFAGYGRRGLVEDLAQRQYQFGVEGIYEDVNQQRAQVLQDLYAQLGDYQSLIGNK
tara:strand:- start:34 stop:711 length:678 start_codon:yes stop_codon:yes gene_type:complete